MKFLELRRHSIRVRPSIHLSQDGVTLARTVGEGMGPFARVIVSPSMWVAETAIAMGFAFDEIYSPVLDQSDWRILAGLISPDATFGEIVEVMRDEPVGRRLSEALVRQWTDYALVLPEGESGLVVTHGGYIDYSAVACLPNEDPTTWGETLGRCEGIRLTFDAGSFIAGQILRVPPEWADRVR